MVRGIIAVKAAARKWEKFLADMDKGLKQGIIAFKRGALVSRRRTVDSSVDQERQYKLIMLKVRMQKELCTLGEHVYASIATDNNRNPGLDAKVKDITAHIKRHEAEITQLERKRGNVREQKQ